MVSVVIPTFRREQLVLEAISSALAQKGVELEVIVVDDTPEGSARAAVEGLGDSRVRYVHPGSASAGHVGAVRNLGASKARGELLHFLDDDDRLADGALAALSQALSRNAAGVAFGRIVPFGDKSEVIEKMQAYYGRAADAGRRIRGKRWFAAQMLFFEWPLVNSACMVRRAVFEACGGYPENVAYCEDIEFYLNAGRAYGTVFVDRDVLHYRVGAPSMTHASLHLDDVPYIQDAHRRLHRSYRADHGMLEYRALQLIAKLARLARVAR